MSFDDPQFDPLPLSFAIGNDDSVQIIHVRPFLRIDNHLIPIKDIKSIDFVPNGLLSTVRDVVYFHEDVAEQHAMDLDAEVETFTAPIIVIEFITRDGWEYIRRHGEAAQNLWRYIADVLSVP